MRDAIIVYFQFVFQQNPPSFPFQIPIPKKWARVGEHTRPEG